MRRAGTSQLAERLSVKQRDLLLILGSYGEPDWEPMTTFALSQAAEFMVEEAWDEDEVRSSYTWRGWGREGILATMKRLEAKGLVARQPHCGYKHPPMTSWRYGFEMAPPARQPARYEWTLTNTGLRLVQELEAELPRGE